MSQGGDAAMTLDDFTDAQFAVLTLMALGCIYLIGVMIRLATEKRED
jgi:hypothetical protein